MSLKPKKASAGGLDELNTPCLILDRRRMQRNLERLRHRMHGLPVKLRPHLKTLKSFAAVASALDSPSGPAAVSTLKEAEEFGRCGVSDLLYAVCLSPQKLPRVSAIRRSGIDLKVVVDSLEMAHHLIAHVRATGDALPVLIEIDTDGHRSGLDRRQAPLLVQIGRVLHEGGAKLLGVMAHAGESYNATDALALAASAQQEQAVTVEMAQALRAAGLPCDLVSIGSTPTIFASASLDGVTEVRVGVYMLFDLAQAGIGVCTPDDIALSVLATVIGRQSDRGWLIIDAGWMAMSNDRSTARQPVDHFYGLVGDIHGRLYTDVVLLRVNQEHGIVAVRPGSEAKLPPLAIGERVRILPNHACATAAQHDAYHVLDHGDVISEVWPRFRGW